MTEYLEKLCTLRGVSGDEAAVREFILDEIRQIPGAAFTVDALGNILAEKKGARRARTRVMLSAHMDEVGLIVTYAEDSGLLKFSCVGGIDPRVLFGHRVLIGKNAVRGTIGTKPYHIQTRNERDSAPSAEKLFIDIGALNRDDALRYVQPGDVATFESDFVHFGDGFLKGRAIDDRAGCAILLEIMESDLPYDLNFAFTVQEEVGTRGAHTAASKIKPQAALVIESTTAADIPGVPEGKKACFLGKGAVVSFMDRRTLYDREFYTLAFDLAHKKGIAVQPKFTVAGGNDAGAIQLTGSGTRVTALSIPCRYLHSPSCVIKEEDAAAVYKLAAEMSAVVAARQC